MCGPNRHDLVHKVVLLLERPTELPDPTEPDAVQELWFVVMKPDAFAHGGL